MGVKRLPAVVALVLPLMLTACGGGDDGDDVASDPAPTSASVTSAPPSPTSSPTVGSYPPFVPQDYTFQLTVSCFCVGAGVPIEVSVVDAVVVSAAYLTGDDGRGAVSKGDPADRFFWLTINDIIDAANDVGAARVEVDWPAGQDYPSAVSVDRRENVADDEVSYTLSDVRVG